MTQKILHVMASGAKGGGADHLRGLLPALKDLHWECEAVVGTDGPLFQELQNLNIPVVAFDMMQSRFNLKTAYQLRSLILKLQPDIVHLHGTRAAFYHGLARRFSKHWPKSIYTAHGLAFRKETSLLRRKLFERIEKFSCDNVDGVISVSLADLHALEKLSALTLRAHVPNAVGSHCFIEYDRQQARQLLNISTDTFVVGTVARLVPQKGLDVLLKSLALLPEAQLVIVGAGPLEQTLKKQANNRVTFLGERHDVPKILSAFDVFALSSRWEGEPIALIEAMAKGLPCVATQTLGAQELIISEQTGLLAPIDNAIEFASQIKRLQADILLRKRLGQNAKDFVSERTYQHQAQKITAIYSALF